MDRQDETRLLVRAFNYGFLEVMISGVGRSTLQPYGLREETEALAGHGRRGTNATDRNASVEQMTRTRVRIPLAGAIVTFPDETVNAFFEMKLAHVPGA